MLSESQLCLELLVNKDLNVNKYREASAVYPLTKTFITVWKDLLKSLKLRLNVL